MSYLELDGIKAAFAEHMMMHRGYSREEADMAVSDFPDPYSNCYLDEDFVGDCEIDGEEYGQYACYTNLWRVGIVGMPEFRFYTYYRRSDIPNNRVGEYKKAKKLYQIDDLDKADFPNWNGKNEEYIELEFCVTICLGHGDGGDVIVTVDVTEEEYDLLKDCCREDEEIESYEGLEALYERIIDAAIDESESCSPDDEDEINYDDVSYIVAMPDEIYNEVQSEEYEDEDEQK